MYMCVYTCITRITRSTRQDEVSNFLRLFVCILLLSSLLLLLGPSLLPQFETIHVDSWEVRREMKGEEMCLDCVCVWGFFYDNFMVTSDGKVARKGV